MITSHHVTVLTFYGLSNLILNTNMKAGWISIEITNNKEGKSTSIFSWKLSSYSLSSQSLRITAEFGE